MGVTAKLRCVVVDDHPFFRDGVVAHLRVLPGVAVVAEAASVAEAVANSPPPDVALLDLGLAETDGAESVEALLRAWPETHVLVLTASERPADLLEAMAVGASGYLVKDLDRAELVQAIGRVASGEVVVTPRLASYMVDQEGRRAADEWSLSPRERDVLNLLATGLSDRQIAQRLSISPHTVQNHLKSVRDKTGRRRRVELAAVAARLGSAPSRSRERRSG